jgi:RNA polymerase sigma factor (TIGR02999 family)
MKESLAAHKVKVAECAFAVQLLVMCEAQGDITRLLKEMRGGNQEAERALFVLVYDELRAVASRRLRQERAGHTLQPTALVHEAYMQLVGQKEKDWKNRAHFFAVAAQLMRRILIDSARRRKAVKRGGDAVIMGVDGIAVATKYELADLILVDQALTRLADLDERQSRVVEMRFFGGLTDEEIGEVLGISSRTVKRDWNMAKVWLHAELAR